MLIGCNRKICVYVITSNKIMVQTKTKDVIVDIVYGKNKILIVTNTSIELMDESLRIIRIFTLLNQKIYSICSKSNGFKVLYTGNVINSQPIVRFLKV
jgi:hypothetical protein